LSGKRPNWKGKGEKKKSIGWFRNIANSRKRGPPPHRKKRETKRGEGSKGGEKPTATSGRDGKALSNHEERGEKKERRKRKKKKKKLKGFQRVEGGGGSFGGERGVAQFQIKRQNMPSG